jgi:hypothetical protein
MELSIPKPFEVPDGGLFLGTIIDVMEAFQQPTKFGPKDKVRIVWVLGKVDGTPALDSEGKPYRAVGSYNASFGDKSSLYQIVQQILNAAPPLLKSTEELSALLIGRSNQLFITKDPNLQKPGSFFANIRGVTPLAPGQVPPQVPAGFVRQKDRPKTQAGPAGRPVQTYAQPPAQQAPATTVAAPGTVNLQTPPSNNQQF